MVLAVVTRHGSILPARQIICIVGTNSWFNLRFRGFLAPGDDGLNQVSRSSRFIWDGLPCGHSKKCFPKFGFLRFFFCRRLSPKESKFNPQVYLTSKQYPLRPTGLNLRDQIATSSPLPSYLILSPCACTFLLLPEQVQFHLAKYVH